MSKKNAQEPDDDDRRFENEPTELDELSHAEMITLYKESTDTVRFAKHLQWWTVGSTLLAFVAIVGIAKLVSADHGYVNTLMAVIILLTSSVIFTLVVYQFWQHTEHQKLEEITRHMSSLFLRVRSLKSEREANIHRYLLLLFMIITVLIAAIVAYLGLDQMFKA